MDEETVRDVQKEENTRCEIYTFYKNENCDTPTRVLLYIALSGFFIVGFLIICFLIASCLRYRRYKEKRQMELITPVSSESRLRECIERKYPNYSRKNSYNIKKQDSHHNINNNNNNNNQGNTGVIEEEFNYNYDYSKSTTNANNNNNGNTNININISRDDVPIPTHSVRGRNKEMLVDRRCNDLNSPYQSTNYKKLYPNLSYENNIDHVVNNDSPYSSQLNSNSNSYYNNDYNIHDNLDEPYYNNRNNNRLTNVDNINSNQYYDESIEYDNDNDAYENKINSRRNKIKNVAYPMNNNQNYYRESYEKYTSDSRKNKSNMNSINVNTDSEDKYNRKISIQINQPSNNIDRNEERNRNSINYYNNKSHHEDDNYNNNNNSNNRGLKNKKPKNNSNVKININYNNVRGDDSNDTLNKNNIKELIDNDPKIPINKMNERQKIYPQKEESRTTIGKKEERKVEVNKKVNISNQKDNDNDITYFNNQNYINQTNQEEYTHNNINNNNGKKIQQEMKMVCAVNRTTASANTNTNINSNSNINNNHNKNSNRNNYNSNNNYTINNNKNSNNSNSNNKSINEINNSNNNINNDITLDQVKNLSRPILKLQPQQSPPSPPIVETEKDKKTKSVNFAPIDYKSNLIRNLSSISPTARGERKISEIKLSNYRPRNEESTIRNNHSDGNSNDYRVNINERPSSSKNNNEIEFEVIDSFEEVQRSINSCENEQIKNQQYLNYMNNINANLNLPSIPINNSLDIEENLNEIEKERIEEAEEEDDIISRKGKEKEHNRKRSKSARSKRNKECISNENQLQRKIMNNPVVQNSSPMANSNNDHINYLENPNSTQNFPNTPHANYTHHQISDNYSVKQIPISPVHNNYSQPNNDYHYLNNKSNIYPSIDINDEQDSDNIFVIQNRYRSRTPSPNRNILPSDNEYMNRSRPMSSYTNNNNPPPSTPMLLYDLEDNNDYSDFAPPRRMLSSAENNIPGPPPTASSSYIPQNNNSRPVSQSTNPNTYYFNEDIGCNGESEDPDYPMYSSYQSPTYYDNSQNQMYMNNMVIPFQKPKVYIREAPILKNSNMKNNCNNN